MCQRTERRKIRKSTIKKNLLKSMLMALALVFGTTCAWADEITATLVHTASSYSGGTAGAFTSTVDAEKEHINNSKFSAAWAGAAYAEFSFAIPEGQTIQSATLTWNGVGSSKNRTTDVLYANAGLTLNYTSEGDAALGSGTASVDLAATNVKTGVSFPANKTTEITTDVTDAVKAMTTASQDYVIFKFTNNAGGGDLVGKGAETGAPVLVINTVSASAQTSYTVKFTDAAGNELKDAVTYDVLIGNQATASASDMASFFNADNTMKYIYESGNQNITAVENAANNVITLVFREAAKYSYILKSNLGTTLNEGSNWEGETMKAAYPRYLLDGTTLYSIGNGDKSIGYFQRQFTLNEDNHEEIVNYTENTTDVVYLAEAEAIEGLTVSTAPNSDIRCSYGLCGYNAGPDDAVIATLPNGKYKLYTSVWGNAGTDFVFKANGEQIYSISSQGYIQDGNSEEFELNGASNTIALVATENAARGIDFVYIVKTGDAEVAAPAAATGMMDFTKMDLPMSTSSSTAGDITEDKTFDVEGEFSVTVSPKTSGSNPTRFWNVNDKPELHIYIAPLTVKAAAGKKLTKIVFGQTKWGKMTANAGTLNGQTWTSEEGVDEVIFDVTAQCRITSITVGDYVAPAEPTTDVANIAAFNALEAGTRAKLALNDAKVTFVSGDNAYVEDATGALLIYKSGLTLTAGKALNGYIYGAYTEYKGLVELTAIDLTPSSEFTETDTELTATVVTVAQVSDAANVSKLVKLENVNIDNGLQTISQGEDKVAFYDKFGVMGNYAYPAFAKSIVGIVHTTSGYNTFHPVSPDSIVAGEAAQPVAESIAAAKTGDLVGKEVKITLTNAKVTVMSEMTMDAIIEDETGAIIVDAAIRNLLGAGGNVVNGTLIATVQKGYRLNYSLAASANTASSELTAEPAEVTGTLMTIADINNASQTDIMYKYVKLENVEVSYDDWGAMTLKQGDATIDVDDAYWTLPEGIEYEKFNSIQGAIGYGYMGYVLNPYGAFDGVEKTIETVEAANIAEMKAMDDETIVKLNLNNAKVSVVEPAMKGGMTVYIEDETAGIQISSDAQTLLASFTEVGQTINGYINCMFSNFGGVYSINDAANTASSEFTVEAGTIEPKVVTVAEAKASDFNEKLVKAENVALTTKTITEGEGEDAYEYDIVIMKSGDDEVMVSDMFNKIGYDEEFNPILFDNCDITGVIMSYPDYNDDWTEIIGHTNYFIPTAIEEKAQAETGRTWDFTAMGAEDEALLAADTEHWTVSKNRYQNSGVAFDNEPIVVGGTELNVTKGLLFTAETGKLLLGSGTTGSNHFMQVQKGSSFKVTGINVGDTVRVVVQTASKAAVTIAVPDASVAKVVEGCEAVVEKHTCTLVMYQAGELTLKGDNADLRFLTLEVKAGNPNEVADVRTWDFTAWSEATVADMTADAATVAPDEDGNYPAVTPWRSYEKVGGPTEADPDREGAAFWYGTEINGAEELAANGVAIAETKGLVFNKMGAGALAIAVDYPSTSLGDYNGGSYLWIGGKNNSFTIPNVKSGSKITMGIESHKNTDARGVKLTIDGEEIGQAVPKTYEVFEIAVPGEITDDVLSDVVVTNTNGCHIYFIKVDASGIEDGINDVNATVKIITNDVYTINGVKVRNAGEGVEGLAKGLYIIGGKKVVIK